MPIVAKKWLACACVVVVTAAFAACSSSNAGGPNVVSDPLEDAGELADSSPIVRADSAPVGDDAGPPSADDAGSDAGVDAATLPSADSGPLAPDASDAASNVDAADAAVPLVSWFCMLTSQSGMLKPFCVGSGVEPNLACGYLSGQTDPNVDAGVWTCEQEGIVVGSPEEPCVVSTARPFCSFFISNSADGGGVWNQGVLTRKCLTNDDCVAPFGGTCEVLSTGNYCN